MTPDVMQQLESLTNTVAQQLAPFMAVIIAGMVVMSYFVVRFGNRLMSSFDRSSQEDDKRIDTFSGLFARQIEINERLTAENTARNQVQLEQSATLTAMLSELKAIRLDLKSWPELTTVAIRDLREQITELEQSVALLVATADNQRMTLEQHNESIANVEKALLSLTALITSVIEQHRKAPEAQQDQAAA